MQKIETILVLDIKRVQIKKIIYVLLTNQKLRSNSIITKIVSEIGSIVNITSAILHFNGSNYVMNSNSPSTFTITSLNLEKENTPTALQVLLRMATQ